MRSLRLLARLTPVLVVVACAEKEPPTAPGRGGPVFSHSGTQVVVTVGTDGAGTCDAHCTLREAIGHASPGDEIIFDPTYCGRRGCEIVLDEGALTIDKNLSITGNVGNVTIRRADFPSTVPLFRIIQITPGATVQLTRLFIRNGHASGSGGGIANAGTLTLVNSGVSNNHADQSGGGIYNDGGALTVTGTSVTDNHTDQSGGGIFSRSGTVALTNDTVSGNKALEDGGGIAATEGATVTLTTSSVVGSRTQRDGGGIFVDGTSSLTLLSSSVTKDTTRDGRGGGIFTAGGPVALTNSTVSRNAVREPNQPGGGIYIQGAPVTLTGSTVSGNSATDGLGGGIYNNPGGTLTLTSSTVSGNNASYGAGGIVNAGRLTLTSSTVSGNSGAGGILNEGGTLTLTNSTVSGNSGGGIANEGGTLTLTGTTVARNSAARGGGIYNAGRLTLTSTIVAENAGRTGPDLFASTGGTITASFSLIGDAGGHSVPQGIDFNIIGVDTRLAPLRNNGGPTQTHALQAGSRAIDAGLTLYPSPGPRACDPATDQRGRVRPRNGGCDMGAFEFVSRAYPFFAGFFGLARMPTLNSFTAGSVVAVRFSLNGDKGLDILATNSLSPMWQRIDCTSLLALGSPHATVAASGGELSYDAATDRYRYDWQTDATWAGSCRQFLLRLSDWTTYRANFQFN